MSAAFCTVAVELLRLPVGQGNGRGRDRDRDVVGACRVREAVPLAFASKVLVAVTVIFCVVEIGSGRNVQARIRIDVPTCGLMLQVTPVELIPNTTGGELLASARRSTSESQD